MKKAKELRFPHSWEERKPALHNRVLFVPRHYAEHHLWKFPGWEDPELFGKSAKVFIEYCSGNGAWVVERAKSSQEHWVAVEQKFERVRKIWAKGQNAALANLLTVCGEALTFTSHYLPEMCVDGVFINFPDPWPKAKHAKNRLLQAPFVSELARILKPGAQVLLVTDDLPYATQVAQELLKHTAFRPIFAAPHFVHEWPDYGTSYFDALWRAKGKSIHYIAFDKVSA